MHRNDRRQRDLIRKLIAARLKPPTLIGLLLAWPSLPLLSLVAMVSVAALVALGLNPLAMLMAGICLGAAARDVGIAGRTVRFWPIQQELLDWQKIDALAQTMSATPSEPDTNPSTGTTPCD